METRVPSPRRIVLTRSGDHDRCNVLVILNGISRREARRNTHVVELPAAHVVEVNVDHNGLDLLHVCRNNVRIPDRTELDLIERRIVRSDLHGGQAGIGLDIDRADHGSIVPLPIADRKLDMMHTVCKHGIRNRHDTVFESARSFHAVDVCLGRGGIQTGIIVSLDLSG